jgi:hypothetical protein
VQGDFPELAGLKAVNPALVEWPGVNVKAHRTLVKLGKIKNLMHWFGGVYLGGHIFVNVEVVRRFEAAVSFFVFLFQHPKVLNTKPAHRNCHPAILIVVVMYLRSLSYLPTYRYELEQVVLKNQIACVVVIAEDQIPFNRPFIYHVAGQIIVDLAGVKVFFRNLTQPGEKVI